MCSKCRSTSFPRPILQSHDYGSYYPYLQYFDHERYRQELDYRRRGFNLQLEEIEGLDPPGRTLVDFGAGVAYFCAIAQERGWKAAAVEVSPEAIKVGERELGVNYVDPANLADRSCSVITAFHVLEHVEAPRDLLRLFHEKLVPGGILVVHVPNVESLASYVYYGLRRFIRGSGQRRGSLYYPEHITGFSRAGLEHCVAAGGFDVVSLRQCSFFSHDHLPVTLDLLTGGPPWKAVPSFARRCMMGMIDNVGHLFGKGDWIVGHFRART
jgi:SAM-dependent methyltransferase